MEQKEGRRGERVRETDLGKAKPREATNRRLSTTLGYDFPGGFVDPLGQAESSAVYQAACLIWKVYFLGALFGRVLARKINCAPCFLLRGGPIVPNSVDGPDFRNLPETTRDGST